MSQIFNIYCDESCHMEHDGIPVMLLGAVWCPQSQRAVIARNIRTLKNKHNLSNKFEIKWNKVSRKKLDFYLELIDYFFNDEHLHFRTVIIPDKGKLNHDAFNQTHDDFYYKMYFRLLTVIFEDDNLYRVYIDIKDTRSQQKVVKLHDVLCNARYDFNKEMINRVQQVHSHELEQLQLCDLLMGAVGYANRELESSDAKIAVVEKIKQRSNLSLVRSTLPSEQKFNIFRWDAQEA